MGKKKFLDIEGVKALKAGVEGELRNRTRGLLLPFDGVESSDGAAIALPSAEPDGDYRVVWVKEFGGFRAVTGGENKLVSYRRGEEPSLVVASIDHFQDKDNIVDSWETEELQFSNETVTSEAFLSMPLDIWMEIEATKVVERETGAEVDAKAIGLRIYAAWEDSRWAGNKTPTSVWLYPFFGTREVSLAEFESVAEWPRWIRENFALTAKYDIPAGATVKILNYWGKGSRTLYSKWPGNSAYVDNEVVREFGLLCKPESMIYRMADGDLVVTEQVGFSREDMEKLHPGFEYGERLLKRWEATEDKSEFHGNVFTSPADRRLATQMPERMPALDLSGCRVVENYPAFVNTEGVSTTREMAGVDVSNVEELGGIGEALMVTLPKLDLGKVKNASSAFTCNRSMIGLSVLGSLTDRGADGCDLPDLVNARNMFKGCSSLIAIPYFEAANCRDMSYFAHTCWSMLAAPWLETGNVTTMNCMFNSCASMHSVPAYDTGKVTDFGLTFWQAKSLRVLPRWTFKSATRMPSMCQRCYSLEETGEIDSGRCTDFSTLFSECRNLRRVESIDMASAESTLNMFAGCRRLEYLVILELPMGGSAMTLDLSGLTAWGTGKAGAESMMLTAEAFLVRTLDPGDVMTMKIPQATYVRWQRVYAEADVKPMDGDLDDLMAAANVTVVMV